MQLLTEQVNIENCPNTDVKHLLTQEDIELTVGDLHGNSLTILYILQRHGIINLAQSDYQRFVEIYNGLQQSFWDKSSDQLIFYLNLFHEILAKIQINKNSIGSLRLIGDELSDRGACDYLTFALFDKIAGSQLKMPIVVSNHSFEFLQALERNLPFHSANISHRQAKSMSNMQTLIDLRLISRSRIEDIANQFYKPHLQLMDYSLDQAQKKISITSHAPIGLSNIKYMALKMGIEYHGNSPIALANTIEKINALFQAEYVNKNRITQIFAPNPSAFLEVLSQSGYATGATINPKKYPFIHLIWNRSEIDPAERPDWTIFQHGHTPTHQQYNVYNLDGALGKFHDICEQNHQGEYCVSYGTGIKL